MPNENASPNVLPIDDGDYHYVIEPVRARGVTVKTPIVAAHVYDVDVESWDDVTYGEIVEINGRRFKLTFDIGKHEATATPVPLTPHEEKALETLRRLTPDEDGNWVGPITSYRVWRTSVTRRDVAGACRKLKPGVGISVEGGQFARDNGRKPRALLPESPIDVSKHRFRRIFS